MSDFRAGFVSRHDAAAALNAAFALPIDSVFEAYDPRERLVATPVKPKGFAPAGQGGPRHFSPLDPETSPTEGWDPIAAAQADAHDFVDPIAAAREAGYAEGFAAAMTQSASDAGRDRALVEALGLALAGGGRLDRDRVARQLRQTVLLLVTRLVGEVGVSAELLSGRIGAAVDLLADSAESAILRLNPDDVPLVEGRLPQSLFPVGDAQVARGSFVLESASTVVEDGPGQWLEQLTQVVERVAVPTC